MTVSEAAGRDPIEQARALLAAKPDGLIEAVAREAGVSTQAALELLPPEQRLFVAPERFEDVWNAVEQLRQVLESGEWRRPEFNQINAVT